MHKAWAKQVKRVLHWLLKIFFAASIGFEVPVGGTAETELTKCATSVSHYYRAQGTNISSAFSAIAANVKHLRLTQ